MENFEIPKIPKKRQLKVKSTRESKLKKWITLLKQFDPYGMFSRALTTNDDFVNDNKDLFKDAILIHRLDAKLEYHDMAYIILYCCFNNDGKFQIIYDGNYEDYDLSDSSSDVLYNHCDDTAVSWQSGYHLMIEIVEKAFGGKNEKHFEPPK
jgi:hypothetical protein